MEPKIKTRPKRILDFDCETVSAGFADPNWVPQRITVIAWSWIGQERVYCFSRLSGAKIMLESFLEAYNKADMVTGHNLIRFDLPIINSDLMRLDLPFLEPKIVQDTMRFVKTKGFKKGQDNLGKLLELANQKMNLIWADWEEAYEWDKLIEGKEVTWKVPRDRCKSDVAMHKQMRQEMLDRGWLKGPVMWKP